MTKFRYKVAKRDEDWAVLDTLTFGIVERLPSRAKARDLAQTMNAQMNAINEINESIAAA